MTPPAVLVFDVNGTLSDMAPLGRRFTELGAPAELRQVWFAGVLRDGFALTAAGAAEPFARIAREGLRTVLRDVPLDRDPDAAVEHVMAGFGELGVHPDVPDGVRSLRAAGRRLVTLSNGAAQVADRLLADAGIRSEFEAVLSVEDAGSWKPAAAAYAYAAQHCGVEPADMMLVAAHPWDIDGARRAGLRTAFVQRRGEPFPGYFGGPDVTVSGVDELARVIRS